MKLLSFSILYEVYKKQSYKMLFIGTDDAFFQPDWAGACWGRWARPGLLRTGLKALDRRSPMQKQEKRRAGGGFARSRSDA